MHHEKPYLLVFVTLACSPTENNTRVAKIRIVLSVCYLSYRKAAKTERERERERGGGA